jgi:cytochrome c biogenesis protein CcmG/thiol:disulfide interchange protein DsbE
MAVKQIRWTRSGIVGFGAITLAIAALLVLLGVRLVAASQAVNSAGSGGISPLVGHAAPDLGITVYNGSNGSGGKTLRLADLRGHPVVVNFWASWCQPCQEETPIVQAAYQKYAGQGVVFVGVDYEDKADAATAFLKQYGVTYPSGPDTSSGESAVAYGVTGPPETVFIDRTGVVRQKNIGMLDDRTLDLAVQGLLQR